MNTVVRSIIYMTLMLFFISGCNSDITNNVTSTQFSTAKKVISKNSDSKPAYNTKGKFDSRIMSPITHILDDYNTKNMDSTDFKTRATMNGIESKNLKIRVVVEFNENIQGKITQKTLIDYDIENGRIGKRWIKGYIPIYLLEDFLINYPSIKRIRNYWKPDRKSIVTEGFDKVGGTQWKNAGYTGTDVKIAIIDDGFEHIDDLVATGDFTGSYFKKDYSGNGFPGIDDHGTESAAIIYDFAPDATYYLITIEDVTDVEDAKDYCKAKKVNIISMSLGWDNYYYGDGKGYLCDIVDDAEADGILWVNCAGNEGRECYWTGQWSDTDNDDWLNFSGNDEANNIFLFNGETVAIRLTWDTSLENSDQDYDIYLIDFTSTQVAWGDSTQDGDDQPIETIIYTAPISGNYNISIYNFNANGTSKMRLFCSIDYNLEYGSSDNSLTSPADAVGALTVGAVHQSDWGIQPVPLEDYSSQGPTSDGRIKPDICGPDGTSEQYGTGTFSGTSCSAPHVAGAAAVFWSSNTAYDNFSVRNYLENMAEDCGPVGKDNAFGNGKLKLGTLPTPDDNYEPNNTVKYAFDFTGSEKTWLDSVNGLGIQNDEDWYEIDVKDRYVNVKVECTFTHSLGNIDIELLNEDGNPFTPLSGSNVSDSTTDNELIVCNVSTFSKYYIRVFNANNGNQYNLRWEVAQVTPEIPANFHVYKTTNTHIYVTWADVLGADNYQIQQGSSDSGPWIDVYDNYKTNYIDKGLPKSTTYWYQLRAVNGAGHSNWTTPISGTTKSGDDSGSCGGTGTENAGTTQLILAFFMVFTLVCIRYARQHYAILH